MDFKALQEMLDLQEADVIDKLQKGVGDAKEKHEQAIQDAEEKRQKAVQDATQKFKKDVGKVADVVKAKTIDKNANVEYTNKFLDNFFSKFPQFGANDAVDDIIDKFPDKPSLHSVFTTFKNVGVRLEALRVGFNKSLLASHKVSQEQITKYNQQARVMAGANAPSPPAALVRFVKNEAKFFKRMINVNDKGELNETDFKELLQLKIKQTAPERVPDAAQALNLLFGYMTSEFKQHAQAIKEAAETLKGELQKTKQAVKAQVEDTPKD
jgi:hypothetical protein